MSWFAAHIVMRVLFKDCQRNHCPVMENICVISAATEEDAQIKAEKIGRSHEGDSEGSFTWDGWPAEWKFVGIRRLVEVRNSRSTNDLIEDGTEITYSSFDFLNIDQLRRFMMEEEVSVTIIE